MARKKIVAGNWKMNKTPSEAVELVKELTPLVKNDDVDVVFCVPQSTLSQLWKLQKVLTSQLVQRICTMKRAEHTQERSLQTC